MDRNKLRAVLSYMEEHNREHARELRGLLAAIKELGADEILDLIENGAKSIEEAAGYIENALASLEEGAAAGLETAAETAEEIL
jgi:ADP-dependent phosphofructokinase/glucokinase